MRLQTAGGSDCAGERADWGRHGFGGMADCLEDTADGAKKVETSDYYSAGHVHAAL